ncbi:unnamed protein product [Adineta steineri]|uniref:G-protein coupled receptors family 1 profile domain-containing protein n=1 Tax=Adineta steineri TaxID=433720 RepID=A0A815H657_9BILA|nr:unnamed protein product [Adineta steineri]CAF3798681.1 unnamed protein product [Adineta steineri]CAF4027942.1 unnamed protein product [Adineta steineri]
MYTYSLYGDLNPSISFDNVWCKIRAYLVFVGYCMFFNTFVLQAMFRLFRIAFYRRKSLQSREFFIIAFIIQWILSFILPLSSLLPNDYEYMPLYFTCWISFQNIRGTLTPIVLIYGSSISVIFFIYVYIIRYIRRTNRIQQVRQRSNERDLLVLKRIVILILVTVSIGLPSVFIFLIYVIGHYLIPYTHHIEGISLITGLFTATICFTIISPQIKKLFRHNQQQIYPIELIGNNQDHRTRTFQQLIHQHQPRSIFN